MLNRKVTLLDEKEYEIPRRSEFSRGINEDVRARMVDLCKTVRGGAIGELQIRIGKEQSGLERYEKLAAVTEQIIAHEKTDPEKVPQYLAELGTYLQGISERMNALQAVVTESREIHQRFWENCNEIALYALSLVPNSMGPDQADSLIDLELAREVTFSLLGLEPPEAKSGSSGSDDPKSPLGKPESTTGGPEESPSSADA